MINDNRNKALSGREVEKLLIKTLDSLSSHPQIDFKYELNFNTGYEKYSKTQFKMDAAVYFENNEIWLIKVTSSIRSDRVKGNQFDAQNIRKITPNVSKIYLVTSDFADSKEVYNRQKYSQDIRKGVLYSMIDDVISINALSLLIRDRALQGLSQGVRSNILGEEAEERIMRALNNEGNIELWNDSIEDYALPKSIDYELFQEILSKFGVRKSEKITALYATRDIPLLERGGQPKTDIYCEVTLTTGLRNINISVKQTSDKRVTIHEGFVEEILEALNVSNDSNLGMALLRLQECGGKINLKKTYPASHLILEENLYRYNRKLIELFFFGIGGNQKDNQVANMLVYNKTFKAMTVDEVIQNALTYSGQFGTPFSFTYPSGGKGKKIQIKAPTNN